MKSRSTSSTFADQSSRKKLCYVDTRTQDLFYLYSNDPFLKGSNSTHLKKLHPVCDSCVKDFSEKKIPRLSRFGGFNSGDPLPLQFSSLTQAEIALVSPINPLLVIAYRKNGCRVASGHVSFISRMSNLMKVIKILPRRVKELEFVRVERQTSCDVEGNPRWNHLLCRRQMCRDFLIFNLMHSPGYETITGGINYENLELLSERDYLDVSVIVDQSIIDQMVAAEEDLGPAPDQMAPEEAASNIPQTAVSVDSEGITVVSVDSSAVIDENAAEISGLAKRIEDEMQVIRVNHRFSRGRR